jgi:hypothetical protein
LIYNKFVKPAFFGHLTVTAAIVKLLLDNAGVKKAGVILVKFKLMSFEQIPKNQENVPEMERPRTSERLLAALKLNRLNFGKVNVLGLENLKEIPIGAKVVIATDHLNNLSVPTSAMVIADKLPIKISAQSSSFSLLENPLGHTGIAAGGKKNFRGIDYDIKNDRPQPLNPDNFSAMAEDLEDGYATIVAAHNPVKNNMLPKKGGYAAAYLAGMTDSYVLPMAVNIKKNEIRAAESGAGIIHNIKATLSLLKERPDVEVMISHPHKLIQAEDIKSFHELFLKHKEGKSLSKDEHAEFSSLRKSLEDASQEIMADLAKMLPEERRGKWQVK